MRRAWWGAVARAAGWLPRAVAPMRTFATLSANRKHGMLSYCHHRVVVLLSVLVWPPCWGPGYGYDLRARARARIRFMSGPWAWVRSVHWSIGWVPTCALPPPPGAGGAGGRGDSTVVKSVGQGPGPQPTRKRRADMAHARTHQRHIVGAVSICYHHPSQNCRYRQIIMSSSRRQAHLIMSTGSASLSFWNELELSNTHPPTLVW